jgi:hypothetical protein
VACLASLTSLTQEGLQSMAHLTRNKELEKTEDLGNFWQVEEPVQHCGLSSGMPARKLKIERKIDKIFLTSAKSASVPSDT